MLLPPVPPEVVVPRGDPEALVGAARVLGAASVRAAEAAVRLETTAAGLADGWTWCGPRSREYQQRSAGTSAGCRTAAGALEEAGLAVLAFARELAAAQALAGRAAARSQELSWARGSLAARWSAAERARDPLQPLSHLAQDAAFRREAEQLADGVSQVAQQVDAVARSTRAADQALARRLQAVAAAAGPVGAAPRVPVERERRWYDSALDQAGGFADGLWDGVSEPVAMVGGLVGLNGDTGGNWGALKDGVVHGATHPGDLVRALVGWDDLAAGEYGHWLGELVPSAVAAFFTGGATAATRATTGVTALEKAGRTVDELAGLSDAELARIVMRGARERPGSVTATGAPVLGRDLSWTGTPESHLGREVENFTGPVTRTDVRSEPLYYGNGHAADAALGSQRSLFWGAPLRDLLAVGSTAEYTRLWALPDAWGPRDTVSVVRLPEGHRGPVWEGTVAPQPAYGPEWSGGAHQQLHHDLLSDHAVWTGPLPWEEVRDLPGAATAAAGGLAGATAVQLPEVQEAGR